MAPDPDRDRLRPAHILESMANSVSALFYSFLVAKLSKTHSVALKHGVLLSLSPKDKCPQVNLLKFDLSCDNAIFCIINNVHPFVKERIWKDIHDIGRRASFHAGCSYYSLPGDTQTLL